MITSETRSGSFLLTNDTATVQTIVQQIVFAGLTIALMSAYEFIEKTFE